MKRLIIVLTAIIFTMPLYAQIERILSVPYIQQDLENNYWCWAAVITSIADFYERVDEKGNPVTRCEVLDYARILGASSGTTPCCDNENACLFTNFEVTGNYSIVKVLQHWTIAASYQSALDFNAVKANIDSRKPVFVIRKYPSTKHALLIIGYSEGQNKQEIIYLDPAKTLNKFIQREEIGPFTNNGSNYTWDGSLTLQTDPPPYSPNTMAISGSTIVCSNPTTYTVSNLPTNHVVYWYSDSKFTYISGQNTNSYTVKSTNNGSGWVRATVSCSRFAVPDMDVTLGVSPFISAVSGPQYNAVGAYATYYAIVSNANVTSYNWTLVPAAYNNYLTFIGNQCNIQWKRAGNYALQVTAQNNCPETGYYYYGLTVSNGGYLSLSPNPASGNVHASVIKARNISTTQDTASVTTSELVTSANQDLESTYTIRIYNGFGTLLYSTKKSGNEFTIPVNNLKDGTYIIEANDGKESYKQQLIVKH